MQHSNNMQTAQVQPHTTQTHHKLDRILTAFSQTPLELFGGPTAALGGGVSSLGGDAPVSRLVLKHLLDDWVLRQVHLEVAEVKARRNDIHEGHVTPCSTPVPQYLLQGWVKPAWHGMAWHRHRHRQALYVVCTKVKGGIRVEV